MSPESLWLEQSVQQFFSHCNWLGKPLSSEPKAPVLDPSESPNWGDLTLSVGEFFRYFSWEKTPTIGVLPSPTPQPTFSSPENRDVTLDDLLNIF